jgi:hypothetical protein
VGRAGAENWVLDVAPAIYAGVIGRGDAMACSKDTTKKITFRLKMRIAYRPKSLPMPWTRAGVRLILKGALRTALCPLSNRSPPRRNGNWKTDSRDRRPKPKPKCQKLRTRDWGTPAYPAGMTAILPHREITPRRPDCVADDAVGCEPVSRRNSLLTGKLTGNFADSGTPPRFWRPVGQ